MAVHRESWRPTKLSSEYGGMAEDLDLDRVIRDPAYRRRVIARLNLVAVDRMTESEAENADSRVSATDQRAPD